MPSSRNYYLTAKNHIKLAMELLDNRHYFASHYFAGISVEAILRALCPVIDGPFDSNHSIEHWASKARSYSGISQNGLNISRASLVEINLRWRANQRYSTPKMLETYLYELGIDRWKRDYVKHSATRMIELALQAVTAGGILWESNNR